MKKALLLLAALTFFDSAYAQPEPREGADDEGGGPKRSLQLKAVDAKFCQTWEVDLFGRARHQRTAGPSLHQEHNWGIAISCETSATEVAGLPWLRFSRRIFGGGLRNSQNGTATILGLTYDARLLALPGYERVESFGFHVGVSPTYIEYQKWDGSVVRGIVHIPHKAVGLRFYASGGRVLESKVIEQRLSKKVKLRHLVIQRNF